MTRELKSNKYAFLFSRIFKKAVLSFIIFVVFYSLLRTMSYEPSLKFFTVLFILTILIIYKLESIVYKKLIYIFYDDKIVQKGGSLFTNYETQLNVKNITHLKLILPFLENKLFGTARIKIESAGSIASEIDLQSIDNYNEIYDLITQTMKNVGFDMKKGDLLSKEKPSPLGVFFEVFKSFIIGLFFLYSFIINLLYDDDGNKNELLYDKIINHIIPIIIFGVFFVFVWHIFKFLDLRKRIYKIYQNAITYKEGFLSKHYSFLPFKNFSDSGLTQTFIDKIFGLYDVKISCQGSGNEILFKNIINGKEMNNKLNELLNNQENETNLNAQTKIKKQAPEDKTNYNYNYQETLKMNFAKTIISPIVIGVSLIIFVGLILFLVFLFKSTHPIDESLKSAAIYAFLNVFAIIDLVALFLIFTSTLIIVVTNYIQYRSTEYHIKPKSINYRYDFLISKDLEFEIQKVTGVVIKKSFIDEWFKTASINFWSIGANTSLNFKNITQKNQIIENILSKFGIKQEEKIYEIKSNFKISEEIKSHIFIFFFLLTFIVFVLFILLKINLLLTVLFFAICSIFYILSYLYKREYYKRSKIIFFKTFVYFQKGWLFKTFYYAKYNDIKDITITKYPLSKEGQIKFDIAGERIIKNRNGDKNIVSNNFAINYVPDIKNKDELIDYIFYKKPDQNQIKNIDQNPEYHALSKPKIIIKPSLKNTIASLFFVIIIFDALFLSIVSFTPSKIAAVVVLMMIAINIIFFLAMYLPVKMTTYIMDNYRILFQGGVFYKKQKSIIYNKIDFINNNQKFLNKIFHNGNVTVNTVGSSKVELTIQDIPNYLEFYENLRNEYENNFYHNQ